MLIPKVLIYSLHGPDKGKRRNISMLHHSSLLEQLKEDTHIPNGEPFYFYQASQIENVTF